MRAAILVTSHYVSPPFTPGTSSRLITSRPLGPRPSPRQSRVTPTLGSLTASEPELSPSTQSPGLHWFSALATFLLPSLQAGSRDHAPAH